MRFKNLIAATLVLFLPLAACAQPAQYEEGTDYKTLATPLPLDGAKGKVQVMELFWYGCPHCYQLEPAMKAWLKSKPAGVEFVRVPAAFNRTKQDGRTPHPWFIHAKVYYAAESLGVGEKIHEPLFQALQEQRRELLTEEDLAGFFATHGVPPKEFKDAFNSFAVETKVVHAMDVTKRSGITGVPAIIVAGKYQVIGKRATSHEDLLRIADYLIAKERGSR